MVSKEGDPVWFHTRHAWLSIDRSEAEEMRELARHDPQEAVRLVWIDRTGKTPVSLARILGKSLEEIEGYPDFTWIGYEEGKHLPRLRALCDILSQKLPALRGLK